MKIYSYIVPRDYGFAPNPFYGVCTLATCMPDIRGHAKLGDWVIGTGSSTNQLSGHLVYAMRVGEVITFDDYWLDPRFACKKPNLCGSLKQGCGDNIYHRLPSGDWIQENSHHTNSDGTPCAANLAKDTKYNSVLVGYEFTYWGKDAQKIPELFFSWDGYDICRREQGYKCKFPETMRDAFVDWIMTLSPGYNGEPAEFSRIIQNGF